MFSFFTKNLASKEKLAYDFTFNDIESGSIVLSNYKDKTLIVVNVASRICDACKEFDTNFLVSSDFEKQITHKEDNERVSNYKIRGRKDMIALVKIY